MTLSCTISSTGISAPTYAQILSSLQASYQSIFGSSAYLGNDSQDGQLLAVFAQAINDNNNSCIQTYNSYSPTYAQGTGLSSVVKINNIRRLIASNSSANVNIVGVAGTIINNGVVQDVSGNNWNLPTQVVISTAGNLIVQATAQNVGAIAAPAGSINIIATPTLGWQSVISTADATLGSPIETDAALRKRQAYSTATSAVAINNSIASAVANVTGVLQSVLYENPSGTADANGVPGHSICVVTSGGAPLDICNAIASRKTPGTGTYGSTSQTVTVGNTSTVINYFAATNTPLTATITIHALPGYTSNMGANAQQALVNFVAGVGIGNSVYLTSAQAACIGVNYHLVSIAFGVNGGAQAVADVNIPFNALASLTLAGTALVLV